jgi:hypothetical protein
MPSVVVAMVNTERSKLQLVARDGENSEEIYVDEWLRMVLLRLEAKSEKWA